MNILWLILSIIVTFIHLLFKGDVGWFTKETGWALSSFFSAIAVFNFTRRRIYGIKVLGTLFLIFWTYSLILQVLDKSLMSFGVYALKDIAFYSLPLFLTLFSGAAYYMWKIIKLWARKQLN